MKVKILPCSIAEAKYVFEKIYMFCVSGGTERREGCVVNSIQGL